MNLFCQPNIYISMCVLFPICMLFGNFIALKAERASGSSDDKECSCNVGALGSISGLGISHGGGHCHPP